MRFLLIIVISLLFWTNTQAQSVDLSPGAKLFFKENAEGQIVARKSFQFISKSENPRLVAIALNISLGMFGVHRMYLGTDLAVPIVYTVTLGGGLILWAVDLGLLIFSEDIKPYMNNPHVFMWNTQQAKSD